MVNPPLPPFIVQKKAKLEETKLPQYFWIPVEPPSPFWTMSERKTPFFFLMLWDNVWKSQGCIVVNGVPREVPRPKPEGRMPWGFFGFGFGQTDDMGWLAFRCCPAPTQFQASGRYSKAHCSQKEKIWHGLGHYSSYTLRPIGLLKWPGKNFYWCGCIRLYPERHFCWIGQCFNSTPFQIRIWNGPSW